MTYANRLLVRDKTRKFYVSALEDERITELVRRTGQQRLVLIRDLLMQAVDTALAANDEANQQQ